MVRILVLEDETLLREEIQEWLQLEGHDVMGAGDGLAGLELARQHPFDLIICDIKMPKLDGFGVLLELSSDPDMVGIPFIFVTALAALDDMRQGMNLGADDYITKPLTSRQLLKAIDTRLKKKALQEKLFQEKLDKLESAVQQKHNQNLLKTKMMGMFSHDFRNPLSAILSSLNLIRNYDDRLTPERKEVHFKKIERLVNRLLQMMEDLLTITAMDAEYPTYNPQLGDITTFVEDIIEDFKYTAADTHTINYTSNVHCNQLFDPKLLRQIISNLVANAIKYSPAGSEVNITLNKAGENIVLEIQDNGIGIPKEEVDTLFEPFKRASNVQQQDGNGLGLAIVKQAIDLHQGTITVKSKENVGSTFRVTIPHHDKEASVGVSS